MTFFHTLVSLSNNILLLIIGIFGIGFLIGLHEFGHFIFCKMFHIHTPSFSIGYGPRIWKKKIGNTLFSISLIPFGGYVEIAGSAEVGQGEQKEAHSRDKNSFAVKPYWQKMLVMSGGIIFNVIFAYLTFIILFAVGFPKTPIVYPLNATPTIAAIIPHSPAATANLQPGDRLIRFNHQDVTSIPKLLDEVRELSGQTIDIRYTRNEREHEVTTTIAPSSSAKNAPGTFGALYQQEALPPAKSFMGAIRGGVSATNDLVKNIGYTLKTIFSQKTMNGVGGPLMIISETVKGASKGIKIFFTLLAFISINLAIINLIPLPITDGGQALFYTVEAILRKEIPEKTKLFIHNISWVGIMILFVYLSIKDVLRIIGW